MQTFGAKMLTIATISIMLTGCSLFGDSGVESAPYELVTADETKEIEVRNYESMVLVSASIDGTSDNSAFRKLFKYITGANEGATEIAMTAPVFMDEDQKGTEIAMTAPVFMAENTNEPSMSFVMPASFTLESTPKPTDPSLTVSEVSNYKVAAIRFSGALSDSNVDEHTQILLNWMQSKGLKQVGEPVKAGYNGPLTLPFLRHNEVLIEIE